MRPHDIAFEPWLQKHSTRITNHNPMKSRQLQPEYESSHLIDQLQGTVNLRRGRKGEVNYRFGSTHTDLLTGSHIDPRMNSSKPSPSSPLTTFRTVSSLVRPSLQACLTTAAATCTDTSRTSERSGRRDASGSCRAGARFARAWIPAMNMPGEIALDRERIVPRPRPG
jgi:hypothetical protein